MDEVSVWYDGLADYIFGIQIALYPWIFFGIHSAFIDNPYTREVRKGFQTIMFLYLLALVAMLLLKIDKWMAFALAVSVLWIYKRVADAAW